LVKITKKGNFLKIINLEDLGTGGANAEEVYEEEPNITMSDLKNLLFIRSKGEILGYVQIESRRYMALSFRETSTNYFFSTC